MNLVLDLDSFRPALPVEAGQLRKTWEALIDRLPIGVYICEPDGTLARYNDKAAQLWGRSPPVGDPKIRYSGARRVLRITGEPLDLDVSPLAEVLRTGVPMRNHEFILERPDGSRVYCLANADPIFDEAGVLLGVVNCFQDITAQKQAEIRQLQEQKVLRAIIETTPECIKIVACDGTLLQMNAAGCQMVETESADQVEGASVLNLIAPEHREEWEQNHKRVCAGEKLSWEFDIVGLKGTRRHMETQAAPLSLPDGSVAHLAVTRDISGRKQQELKLREQEARLRGILESLPAAVYTTDVEGRITFFNQAAVELSGRVPELGTDQWCVTWKLFWPDGTPLPHDQCPMSIALKEGRPVRNVEAVAERPDGTRVPFLPFPTPLRNAEGEIIGAVNMLVDLTERKKAEERLHLLVREVDHRGNNLLSVVGAAMNFTLTDDVDTFRKIMHGRISALANSQRLLSAARWEQADLRELIHAELEPYGNKCAELEGPDVALKPASAQAIAVIMHELATNAAKYGALSVSTGRIAIGWTRAEGDLIVRWREIGGPPVKRPTRRGFGSTAIRASIERQMDGTLSIDWDPAGVVYEFRIPAKELRQGAEHLTGSLGF
jgi:PAS domain S-box-containing protein